MLCCDVAIEEVREDIYDSDDTEPARLAKRSFVVLFTQKFLSCINVNNLEEMFILENELTKLVRGKSLHKPYL